MDEVEFCAETDNTVLAVLGEESSSGELVKSSLPDQE